MRPVQLVAHFRHFAAQVVQLLFPISRVPVVQALSLLGVKVPPALQHGNGCVLLQLRIALFEIHALGHSLEDVLGVNLCRCTHACTGLLQGYRHVEGHGCALGCTAQLPQPPVAVRWPCIAVQVFQEAHDVLRLLHTVGLVNGLLHGARFRLVVHQPGHVFDGQHKGIVVAHLLHVAAPQLGEGHNLDGVAGFWG